VLIIATGASESVRDLIQILSAEPIVINVPGLVGARFRNISLRNMDRHHRHRCWVNSPSLMATVAGISMVILLVWRQLRRVPGKLTLRENRDVSLVLRLVFIPT